MPKSAYGYGRLPQVTTGIVGTRALYEALGMHGRTDVALALLRQITYPSYGHMV